MDALPMTSEEDRLTRALAAMRRERDEARARLHSSLAERDLLRADLKQARYELEEARAAAQASQAEWTASFADMRGRWERAAGELARANRDWAQARLEADDARAALRELLRASCIGPMDEFNAELPRAQAAASRLLSRVGA